jgi:hypothetical protein
MKAGVRISPRIMRITPVRALPSVAAIEKSKRGAVIKRAYRAIRQFAKPKAMARAV